MRVGGRHGVGEVAALCHCCHGRVLKRQQKAEQKKGNQKRNNRTRSGYRTGMLWQCTRSWLAQSNYTFDVKAIASLGVFRLFHWRQWREQLRLFVKWELKWAWCLARDKTDCKCMSWGLLWVLSVKMRRLEYGGKQWKSQRSTFNMTLM